MPQRVRQVLGQLFALISNELATRLEQMLVGFEQQLLRMAEQARDPALQSDHLEALRLIRLGRGELVPRYLAALEESLARLRDRPDEPGDGSGNGEASAFHNLSLVDDNDLDEDNVLRDMAAHAQTRANPALQLLGQRFGVLAATPAQDAAQLPVGPRALGRILRESSRGLGLGPEPRMRLFRSFDRQVMAHYSSLAGRMDALLVENGILPGLAYVPLRLRPVAKSLGHGDGDAQASAPAPAATGDDAATDPTAAANPAHAPDRERSQADRIESATDATATFPMLQQLLAARRTTDAAVRPAQSGRPPSADSGSGQRNPVRALSRSDAIRALDALSPDALTLDAATPDTGIGGLAALRQALLARASEIDGDPVGLSYQDSDTFELLDLLYAQIDRRLRHDSEAPSLLGRLQLPLLRLVLQDHAFFSDNRHPARQLLNTVAESGADWAGDDDTDPQLAEKLRHAVEQLIENRRDPTAFESANRDLQAHLRTLAHKAEIAERRHVEAARGQEKLELAKRDAVGAIAELLRDRPLPGLMRTLLDRAWTDALTLTLLRHGEGSPEWHQQISATRRIVASATDDDAPAADQALIGQIQGSLLQVGYHVDEASAIARHLGNGAVDVAESSDDALASPTALALRLKKRTRLGADHAAHKAPPAPRTADEQAAYDRLRALPFGTWFEFTVNPQGDRLRRRLSWFSPVTDNALFVNRRGQRVGEQSFDSLARMLAHGQVRVVTADREGLVDRAWQGALKTLRAFSGNDSDGGPVA